ncbi:DNA primase [Scytonema hofmannii PCC 7110]|uniref:DNA primase n=1 Tax=Scytonema hofmannii PCC 7110 TaxID=128403 RepID=A0A139WQJ8_9CYAN|nr:PriCT-2 domain-containing protein [Scytonema hofmannii]KYC34695.1 DNA primase [Scytonema hofmannii PCC 7110]
MHPTPLNNFIDALSALPQHWHIVPTVGKQPQGHNWEQHPFSPEELRLELARNGRVKVLEKSGKTRQVYPTGIAVICGKNSQEFLIAVDCDGISAYRKITQLVNSQEPEKKLEQPEFLTKLIALEHLPPTVAFTSGRPNRTQYLYRIPIAKNGVWHDVPEVDRLKSRKISTAKEELLELRGQNLCSVLPPSLHPNGSYYKWLPGYSILEKPVTRAPSWVVEQMLGSEKRRKPIPTIKKYKGECLRVDICPNNTNIQTALVLLEVIHPRFADQYETWIQVGMALKSVSPTLLRDWEKWSQLSPKYKPGECEYKWNSFRKWGITIRTLYKLANLS